MADPMVSLPYSQYNALVGGGLTTGSNAITDITSLIGNLWSTGQASNATTQALGSTNQGVASANQAVQGALTAASGYAQPYISAGASVLPSYMQAVGQQAPTYEQLYGQVSGQYSPYSTVGTEAAGQQIGAANAIGAVPGTAAYNQQMAQYYSPYTAMGTQAASQLPGAVNALQAQGTAQDYYNRVSPYYQQNIDAGLNALNPAARVAANTESGYGYSDFENSGYYKALEAANLKAQQALAAQAGATGMTGSGTMANALGKAMQSNYATFFGQAQQADLQTKQAAAQQYQYLIGQGLNAQQAASTVANNMMSADTGKNQAVMNALSTLTGQGISAQGQQLSAATSQQQADIAQRQAAANAYNALAAQGLNATNQAQTGAMNLGALDVSQTGQNLNALYNAAQMGNATAQQLMQNYLTGANIIGQNTLQGAQAQAAAAQQLAALSGKTGTTITNTLGSLLSNPAVSTEIKKAAENVKNWLSGGSPPTPEEVAALNDYYGYNIVSTVDLSQLDPATAFSYQDSVIDFLNNDTYFPTYESQVEYLTSLGWNPDDYLE